MKPEDSLRIILKSLEQDLTDASREFLPDAYALGKGYAQAKSGHPVMAGGFDRDIAFQSVGFQMDKINKMIQRMDSEILAINPAEFDNVAQYMAQVEKTFDKFAARSHAIKFYAEQPFFDGWVQGGKEVATEMAKEQGVTQEEIGFTWRTAGDERVCFPAGQPVTAVNGDIPIEKILPGVTVVTQTGHHKVIATVKSCYKNLMVAIKTENKLITATSDHLIFEETKGWVRAEALLVGDIVQTVNNEGSKIIGIVHFILFNSKNLKALRNKKTISFVISLGNRRVPVMAIYFEGDAQFWEQEINAVPLNWSFLNISNLKIFENLADFLFRKSLALKAPITRKAAKLMILAARLFSKVFPATLAGENNGWPTTFLRTKTLLPTFFTCSKRFATSFADDNFVMGGAASYRAYFIAVSDRSINDKVFFAYWAGLRNFFGGSPDILASHGASTFTPSNARGRSINTHAANFANKKSPSFGRFMVTMGRAKIGRWLSFAVMGASKFYFAKLAGMFKYAASPLEILYHRLFGIRNIYVYNLEVESDPTYHVNGVLVHNCPVCQALDGQWFPLVGGEQVSWSSHIGCRCPEHFVYDQKPKGG